MGLGLAEAVRVGWGVLVGVGGDLWVGEAVDEGGNALGVMVEWSAGMLQADKIRANRLKPKGALINTTFFIFFSKSIRPPQEPLFKRINNLLWDFRPNIFTFIEKTGFFNHRYNAALVYNGFGITCFQSWTHVKFLDNFARA